ncbi:DUF2191 domain-containing protein [Polynucleobacter campilacus]|uniref:DUF2191 domain-containing protein n=1 Tax=Polynucleobacter campilacus TaxID=1743163 RepID=UPI000B5048FB|nr:DUF2191 domain-containing protein [Polynucleobacter campilacus]
MKLDIDEKLIHSAMEYVNPKTAPADLIHELVSAFIRLNAGKNLVALGGKSPKMENIPR